MVLGAVVTLNTECPCLLFTLQPEEQLQPEEADQQPEQAAAAGAPAQAAPAAPQPDDTIVAQLISMGFSENGSKRAALAVSNAGVAGWVIAFAGFVQACFLL